LPAQLRIGLLTLALVLTGLTTTVLANDLHWAHSFVTGRVTIVLVIMLVAMICGTMAILVTQIR
jgi:phosphotransferase system  glucose/maltose/N-acetylglucosamine-specific IIC component